MSRINTVGIKPDWDLIRQMVSEGYISARPHIHFPELVIYNYTPKTQYDQFWNEATLMCRGLIAVGENVIARPFSKFFNHSELDTDSIPLHLDYEVFEKLDGSLGISYVHNGVVRISTRGSMNSEQAEFATKYLQENWPKWMPRKNRTYLFEIIYPSNRIVVDYGNKSGIVLLAILDTETGQEVSDDISWSVPFEDVEYIGNTSIDCLKITERENKEGFVVVFENGFRIKIKHAEYVRLHKIITGTSNRTIWKALREGSDMKEILENIPDEFYEWVKKTIEDLRGKFSLVEDEAKTYFAGTPEGDRRQIAEYFKAHDHPAILFGMLDERDYRDYIWKMLKPEISLPFKVEA